MPPHLTWLENTLIGCFGCEPLGLNRFRLSNLAVNSSEPTMRNGYGQAQTHGRVTLPLNPWRPRIATLPRPQAGQDDEVERDHERDADPSHPPSLPQTKTPAGRNRRGSRD